GRLHIRRSVEASLRRLDTDRIDLFQVHQMDPMTPVEETLDVLEDLRREGKILYGGSCNFSPVATAAAQIAAARLGVEGFACLQPRYNLLHRHCEHATFPLAAAEGLGVIPYNPLAGGFLTAKHRGRRPDEEPPAGRFSLPGMSGTTYRTRYWNDAMFARAERIFALCDAAGLAPARVAVGWVLAQPAVTAPILGASRADQLDDVLPAFAEPLPDDLLAALDDATRDDTLEWRQ
ncbi:MAG: aldo/keto reductase, partial [Actinomycetota bacterium]